MRPRRRAYRGTQNNRRKTVGAVVVAGVLVAGGLAGVQIASASTNTEAGNLVTVDGQQFDVSACAKLEINGGAVICDGKELQPVQSQDAQDAALASAQALDAACDQFAADEAAAGGAQAGGAQAGGAQAGDAQAGDAQAGGAQAGGAADDAGDDQAAGAAGEKRPPPP
jgi:hypothetical protein